jgi:hypothetical protein
MINAWLFQINNFDLKEWLTIRKVYPYIVLIKHFLGLELSN